MKQQSKQLFFYYTLPPTQQLHYYTPIPKQHNLSKKIFKQLFHQLYQKFQTLNNLFIQNNQQPSTSSQFHFTNQPKFNLSFPYIHSKNSHFPQYHPFNYYTYKKFPLLPQLHYTKE
ncbi:TIGR01741 family protein, partial [Staphylococcus epidermidis]|uniref:TIGR01741 family protein n=1 Tax=Staphylococcus epidermidis TaxID=1282 RepID=UPI0037DA0EBF